MIRNLIDLIKTGTLPTGGDKPTDIKSKISPEDLEKFINFLPEGKRSPVDFANELGKRGYWGAADMFKGAQDTAGAFGKDGRTLPQAPNVAYKNNRINSQLWHQELINSVLGTAKKLGMKNKAEMMNNKDLLLQQSSLGKEGFDAVMKQGFAAGKTRGDNFWDTVGGLYEDLNKRGTEQPNLIAKK